MSRPTDRFDLIGALADAGESGLDALRKGFHTKDGEQIDINGFIALTKEHSPTIATLLREQGLDAVRALFHYIDGDGDGLVSWDDVWSYAEGSARQRMETKPAERIHNYSFSRFLKREDNVLHMQYFPSMDRLITCSRHQPLQIVDPLTLNPQHSFSVSSLGGTGVMPETLAYMPEIDTLAAFCSDMRLRLWALQDSSVYSMKPFMCEYRISKLACQRNSPILFAGDRSGQLTLFDINRQSLNEPRLRESFPIVDTYPCEEGGIADFVFVSNKEQQIVAALYDNHAITLVDVPTKKWHEIGHSRTAVSHMTHCDAYQCVAVATIDNEIAAWVTHQSQSPCTMLSDPSRPHLDRIIGLSHVEGTPQVISTDANGLIKVWDLRMFRCAQSLLVGSAAEGADGESESSGLAGVAARNAAYNSACFINSTKEVVCSDSRGIVCHEYAQNTDPTLADQNETISLAYNASANTFVTTSASSLSLWDAEAGVLISQSSTAALSVKALHKKDPGARNDVVERFGETKHWSPKKKVEPKVDCHRPLSPRTAPHQLNADITCLCLDGKGRRVFMGTQNGTVHVRSYHGNNLLKRLHLHHGPVVSILYSEQHRALISCGVDSTVSVYYESDPSSPLARMKLGSTPLVALDICPELGLIATGNKVGRVYILDLHHPRMIQHDLDPPKLPCDVGVRGVTFLSRFPLLAVGHQNGRVVIWTVRPVLEATRVMAFSGFTIAPSLRQELKPQTAQLADFLAKEDAALGNAGASDNAVQLTTMAFDQFEHDLLIGNSKGEMSVWSMCPLFQGLDLSHCSYPGTPMFTINPPPKSERSRMKPVLKATWKAHKDEVVSMCVVDIFSLLMTAGGDRKIRVWKYDGTKCGDLSQGRMPEEPRSRSSPSGSDPATPTKGASSDKMVMGQKQAMSPSSRDKLIRRVMTKIEAFSLLKSKHGIIQAKCTHNLSELEKTPMMSPQGDLMTKHSSGKLLVDSAAPSPQREQEGQANGDAPFQQQPSEEMELRMMTTEADLNLSTMDRDDLTPLTSTTCSSRVSNAPAAEFKRLLEGKRHTVRLKPGSVKTKAKNASLATHNEEHLSTLLGEPMFDTSRTPTPPLQEQDEKAAVCDDANQPPLVAEDPSIDQQSTVEPSNAQLDDSSGHDDDVVEDAVSIPTAMPIAQDVAPPAPSTGLVEAVGKVADPDLEDVAVSTPLPEIETLPLTTEQVFEINSQRLRDITTAQQLKALHERRQAHSARGAAGVGVARLIEQAPGSAGGARRTQSGLIRGLPRSARPLRQLSAPGSLKPTAIQAERSPMQPKQPLASPRQVADSSLPSSARVRHTRAPTKPLGRLMRPRPPAKADSHTRRLETYEDELKRCLGWNMKDLHEKLADNNTTARNWSTARLRHELFNTAAMTPLDE